MPRIQTIRRPPIPSRVALRFILVLTAIYVVAGMLAYLLIRLVPPPARSGEVSFPPAFWLTTVLLAVGSASLQHAVRSVRLERQKPFRRSLIVSLVAGTLFVGIQSYGLRCLVQNQIADEVQTGANAFLTMLATLHAMHFLLALMFLVWVTLSALADRYDHEYSWGVTVCAWFWHALGIVWLLILVVFAIACLPGSQTLT